MPSLIRRPASRAPRPNPTRFPAIYSNGGGLTNACRFFSSIALRRQSQFCSAVKRSCITIAA